MKKGRVLSGMRPSGKLHLGHLLGALDNWKKMQKEYECFYFVADWHALTTEYSETSQVKEFTRDMVMDWISAGIDPQVSTLFIQSHVPEHAELHLLLSMITPLPWLERNPTYKEQLQEVTTRDLSTYGFLGYPVLQAADILIYKANFVPVGIDQMPHIELTREITRRFNYLYKEVLVVPDGKLTEYPKIPGTDGRKMSKSYDNCLYLSDSREVITQKIKTMVTDPARVRKSDKGDPNKCPVYDLHKVFTPQERRDKEIIPGCTQALFGCLDCKGILLEYVLPVFDELHARRAPLEKNPQKIDEILEEGSQRARQQAAKTLKEVKEAMKIA